jgi:hypothetical protein
MAMWGCAGQTIYDPDSKLSPPAAAVAGSHLLGPPGTRESHARLGQVTWSGRTKSRGRPTQGQSHAGLSGMSSFLPKSDHVF